MAATSACKEPPPDLPIWDTHLHLLNSARLPYRQNRTYTPATAQPADLLRKSPATNFLIVQASVENGKEGVLTHVRDLQEEYPERSFRAEIEYYEASTGDDYTWSEARLEALHGAGVRCLRLRVPTDGDSDRTAAAIEHLLRGQLGEIAGRQAWAVSMQLPLQVWSALSSFLEFENNDLAIIAEHCGSISVPLSPSEMEAFDRLVHLLRSGKLFVKLGALHRRIADNETMADLQQGIRKMADAGPGHLLWGSDWPHVDSTPRGYVENANLEVDEKEELDLILECMPSWVAKEMLVYTPPRLFV
ncbi:unnamed protein product [Zymoseptoria tritici ST99CH_1A5]|uniref:Amidohydrolase-related domain-containing protein n=1 Tax=Zymoseptoria tritici ST99CH_1A5 TaxID=1276529 RepID=A0A1Y6LQR6_ZYMTR|nr:unnamed protein product [Zymoseptoria tritici ST99CH_3D1]SMY25778.1 unnamed protein product [Zymoseptoria tritici ST99CH_1A5]